MQLRIAERNSWFEEGIKLDEEARARRVKLDDAKKKKLDKEIRALYQMTVKTWPAREAMEKANAAIAKATSRDEYQAAGQKRDEAMYDLFKKKFRIEKEDMPYFDDFWMGVAQHAVVASDKKNGLAAIEKLEKKYKGNQRYMNYFRGIRTKLEAL